MWISFLLWAQEKNSDRWLCLDEWYYSGREKRRQVTVSELVQGMETMLGDRWPYRVIIDPSAAALDVELRKAGYSTLAADNDVLNGISDVSTMLQKGKLLFSSSCVHTIEEFGVYCWDEKAAQNGIDRPVKENDHCLTGETIVETIFGGKKIKDIIGKIGLLWSVKNGKRCIRPFFGARKTRTNQKILKITTDNGKVIRCTEDHKILTRNGWKKAKYLNANDDIVDVLD